MIEKLLKKENIILGKEVTGWEEAIHLSLEPLVSGGYCTDEYEKAVLETTKRLGPYYVLCENIALIHASAFDAVNESQVAITTLKQPVKFSEDGYDVRILVALIAKDGSSHIEVLQAMANIFDDEERINEIIEATDSKEVLDLFIRSVDE